MLTCLVSSFSIVVFRQHLRRGGGDISARRAHAHAGNDLPHSVDIARQELKLSDVVSPCHGEDVIRAPRKLAGKVQGFDVMPGAAAVVERRGNLMWSACTRSLADMGQLLSP